MNMSSSYNPSIDETSLNVIITCDLFPPGQSGGASRLSFSWAPESLPAWHAYAYADMAWSMTDTVLRYCEFLRRADQLGRVLNLDKEARDWARVATTVGQATFEKHNIPIKVRFGSHADTHLSGGSRPVWVPAMSHKSDLDWGWRLALEFVDTPLTQGTRQSIVNNLSVPPSSYCLPTIE